MNNILIVDDDKNFRELFADILKREGYNVKTVSNGYDALKLLQAEEFNLLITDLQMPEMNGIELLEQIKKRSIEVVPIVITAFGTVDSAVQSMKLSAHDYICKPFDEEEMKIVISKGLKQSEAQKKEIFIEDHLKSEKNFGNIIGRSLSMEKVFQLINKVSQTDSTVLIQGESGTGKELVARAIHNNSPRKDKPFIAINCAVLNENLLDSELFGHEKGAFTGATERRIGRFELANGGTLFLDEIADISPAIQSKLLRVLQEKEFERLGGVSTIKVDVRLVAATNVNLKEAVQNHKFREDLFYRLNVISICLPPLRERPEDIVLLANHFVNMFAKKFEKPVKKLSDTAIKKLESYHWSGNIRELENVIERAVVLSESDMLKDEDFSELDIQKTVDEKVLPAQQLTTNGSFSLTEKAQEVARDYEIQMITEALKKTHGNISKASELLGITRVSLTNKVKAYKIDIDKFRSE